MTLEEAIVLALQNKLNEDLADEVAKDLIEKVDVYKICMNTFAGKTLYLSVPYDNKNINWKDRKSFEWTFDYSSAIQFNTEREAEEFAKKYFKNFNRWYIKKQYTYI